MELICSFNIECGNVGCFHKTGHKENFICSCNYCSFAGKSIKCKSVIKEDRLNKLKKINGSIL